MRGKKERGWEEKNEKRKKNRWADTWELGGRQDTNNSPALPKPKCKTCQEDQGHNHCQDDPASGAVMICGRGAHKSVFSNPLTVLLHFHAFPLLFKCLPQQSLLPYFLSYPSSEMTPSNLLSYIYGALIFNSCISYFYSFWVWSPKNPPIFHLALLLCLRTTYSHPSGAPVPPHPSRG